MRISGGFACLALAAALTAAPPSDGISRLAKGVAAYEQKDFGGAAAQLRGLRIPKLADYVAYYLSAARVELKDPGVTGRDLEAVRTAPVASPLAPRTWLVEGRALLAAGSPQEAAAVLRKHYADLSQPEGDLALAMSYEAARILPLAAAAYQKVYYGYPFSEASGRAAAALASLKDAMGADYPPPTPQMMVDRADKLLAGRDYSRAKVEYQGLIAQLSGVERDLARVGLGATDALNGNWASAARYLRGLDLDESEADARRWYHLAECARRLSNDDDLDSALHNLARRYPKSSWRFKALFLGANRYLVARRPDKYIPLYRAAYENFPSEPQAPLCHWKVTWDAYIRRQGDARELLRRHLAQFPQHTTASAALYFLGRLAERQQDYSGARAYYSRIVELFPNYYYGTLARERIGQGKLAGAATSASIGEFLDGVAFPPRPKRALRPTAATSARMERARLLRSGAMDNLADAELRFGARADGQPELLAVELARGGSSAFERLRLMKSVPVDYLAMNLDEADRRFWEYLFPLPYQTELVRSARSQALDPFAVAGLIRQESEFNPRALSPANAYGLTQVRPATGRQLARRVGVRRFSTRMLFQPGTNLKLGTYYMRSLLDNWGGKWEQTLASYNAGPGRAKEWITWYDYQEPAEFVETIPFTETREYVQAVLRNAALYRQIYGNRSWTAAPEKTRAAKSSKLKSKPIVKTRHVAKKTRRKK